MKEHILELTVEQEFSLTKYRREASEMPHDALVDLLIEVMRQNMIRTNFFQQELKKEFPLF